MRPHLPEEELTAYLDGELSAKQRAEIAAHLVKCTECRILLSQTLAVKDRATALLGVASPLAMRRKNARPQEPVRVTPGRWLRRHLPLMAAGVGTLLVVGSYLRGDGSGPSDSNGVSAAFVTPFRLHPRNPGTTRDPSSGFSLSDRALAIAATVNSTPRMVTVAGKVTVILPEATAVLDPIEQQLAEGWHSVPLAVAVVEAGGNLPHLDGLRVNEIRVLESPLGARPTLLSRYLLPDGRSVWLAEGAEEELLSVQSMLQQNGLSVSIPRRTRPDYLVTGEGTRRTNRLVIIAATLPTDSVNALVSRVK